MEITLFLGSFLWLIHLIDCKGTINSTIILPCPADRSMSKSSDISSFYLLCLAPSGACEHRQRDVFRATCSRRLRYLLQPPGGSRPLLHHCLQLLRGDACRDVSSDREGHLVSVTGAAAAYCVELLQSNRSAPLRSTWGKKDFVGVSMRLVFYTYVFLCVPHDAHIWDHVEIWTQCLWDALDSLFLIKH